MKRLAHFAVVVGIALGSISSVRSQQKDIGDFLKEEVFAVELRENLPQLPQLTLGRLGVALSSPQNVPGNGPPILFSRFTAAPAFVDLKESLVISTLPKPGAWMHTVHIGIAKGERCVSPEEVARSPSCKAPRPHFVAPITMPGAPLASAGAQDGVICTSPIASKREIIFHTLDMKCVQKVIFSLP